MFTIRLLSGGVFWYFDSDRRYQFHQRDAHRHLYRRTELAVMESVGMTQKQVRRMLMLEGIYYAGITLVLILTLGSGILYLVGFMTEKTADYAVYRYPWGWLAILSSLIFAICILVPILVYRVAAKESITARLRHMGEKNPFSISEKGFLQIDFLPGKCYTELKKRKGKMHHAAYFDCRR